jgi:hypothetical protein
MNRIVPAANRKPMNRSSSFIDLFPGEGPAKPDYATLRPVGWPRRQIR